MIVMKDDYTIEKHISSVDYISGVLAGKVPEDIDRHYLRDERLSKYESNRKSCIGTPFMNKSFD